ncbi:hypothetical protein Tco_0316126 [Tanacetum coccineum]
MAVLESCPKHNMVAYLEKTEGNAEFHEVIDFLARSSIHHALTVSPVVSTTFVEQFWMSAKSKIINNVRYITAKVAGKPVSISEASIRSDLLFDDADGIDSLPNQAIFDAIQLMGYEGDLTVLTFNKALFSPQWRFLFHTMNHCISSKSTSWDQIPTNIATAVICLTSNQKYNFSKLIFDGMLRHLDAKKKFVMYPRFISIFLDKQLVNVPVPLDHFPVNALTSKVFSFMVKKGKHFSGKVTPLFASMLVQSTEDEGATSERPSEPQPTPSPPHPSEANIEPQSDPSPRPSPTPHIPDSIPEVSGGNHGGQSSSDKSLSGNEGDMTLQSVYDLCISLCTQVTDQAKEIKHLKAHIKKLKKQAKPVITHHRAWMKSGRKSAKAEPSVHKDPLFDELDDDEINNMDTEDAQDVGRTRNGVNKLSSCSALYVSPRSRAVACLLEPDYLLEAEAVNYSRQERIVPVYTEGKVTSRVPNNRVDILTACTTLHMTYDKDFQMLTYKDCSPKDEQAQHRLANSRRAKTLEDALILNHRGVFLNLKRSLSIARDEDGGGFRGMVGMARKLQEDWGNRIRKKKISEEEAIKTALQMNYDFIPSNN